VPGVCVQRHGDLSTIHWGGRYKALKKHLSRFSRVLLLRQDNRSQMEPAVVILPGSWHLPIHYEDLVLHLKSNGFSDVTCHQHASTTKNYPLPKDATLEQDTVLLRHVLQPLAEAGKPIILVAHSYGGIVGNNSLDGLLWVQRQALGKPGGVVHIVYFAALIIPAETALVTPFGGNIPPWQYEKDDGTLWMNDPRVDFYNHLDDDEAQRWLEKTVYCPSSVIKDVQQYAPFEHVGNGLDATYIVCTGDAVAKPEFQEMMASLLGDARKMEYCDSGHCAMIGNADDIAVLVGRAWTVSKQRLESAAV
jgi:hypothetical protein